MALIPLLATALLVPASAVAQDRTIAVNGEVTQQVPNDTAGFGFSVSVERRTRGAALSAVSGRLRTVIAAVQAVPGVGPGDVTTGRISVRKGSHGKRVVYRASEGIAVVLHQPDQAGNLVGVAIRAGATGTSGPNFFVGDSQLAYNRALVAAFDQAKARAAALAAEAGASLGPVVSIEEGGGVSVQPAAGEKGNLRHRVRQPHSRRQGRPDEMHRPLPTCQARHLHCHRDRARSLRSSMTTSPPSSSNDT